MSTVKEFLGGWLKSIQTSPLYEFEDLGRQAVYFLIIGFSTWCICLGVYRGMHCERMSVTRTTLLTLRL